jgi:hypothetical protein
MKSRSAAILLPARGVRDDLTCNKAFLPQLTLAGDQTRLFLTSLLVN